jgi:hypothetical protein
MGTIQMTVSWEACHHFLVFFSGAEDDNKPPDSSSSLDFFSLNAKDDNKLGGF